MSFCLLQGKWDPSREGVAPPRFPHTLNYTELTYCTRTYALPPPLPPPFDISTIAPDHPALCLPTSSASSLGASPPSVSCSAVLCSIRERYLQLCLPFLWRASRRLSSFSHPPRLLRTSRRLWPGLLCQFRSKLFSPPYHCWRGCLRLHFWAQSD